MINYNKYSKMFDLYRQPRLLTYQVLNEQIKHSKHAKILDFGCGTGNYIKLLSKEYPDSKIYGYEPSSHMAAVAKTKSLTLLRKLSDMPDASLDIIYMVNVLHHIKNLYMTFKTVSSLLSPNGKLIIITESPGDIKDKIWVNYFPSIVKIDENRFYAMDEICNTAFINKMSLNAQITYNDTYNDLSAKNIYTLAASKSISVLHEVPEVEYTQGLKKLQDVCIVKSIRPSLKVKKQCYIFIK